MASASQPATPTRPAIRLPQSLHRPALVLLLIAVVVAPLWHLHVMNRWMHGRTDLLPPWLATRVVLEGGDPYSDVTTKQIQLSYYGHILSPSETEKDEQAFAYPIYTAILLAPLAYLNWGVARALYFCAATVMITLSVPIWLQLTGLRIRANQMALLIVLVLASWPVMVALRHQQLSILVFALITAGCVLLRHKRETSAAILFALSTIKPQLTVALIAWLLLWAISGRRWRFLASLLAALCGLFLAGEWMLHGWIREWLAAMIHYTHYTHSTFLVPILFILIPVIGQWVGDAFLLLLALAVCLCLWKLRRCRAASAEFGIAVSLCLAIMVTLSPATLVWVYNQVDLLPGFLILLYARSANRPAYLARQIALGFLALNFALVFLAVLGETASGPSKSWDLLPYWNVLLPAVVTVALCLRFKVGGDTPDNLQPALLLP
ncbi:glycosyltransferase family 87 protein [Edaphobacter bradus]|uniref:glycosyltransferase family 87 protein n=1 Tax=Edaphobacter bradus TaxID=2259016 RepID=UPI0021DF682B|nr:glycosyltransferase family 87 protein [Edaphobacter bradus]